MDLLHTLERDMKSEVDELKKSLNVSSKSEIDTTKLNKLHKKERSTNLIIYGTNDFETPSDPDFEEEEIDNIVRSVCNLTLENDITPKIKAISRIGQFNQNKSRPIKVEFNSSSTVANILLLIKRGHIYIFIFVPVWQKSNKSLTPVSQVNY